MKRNFAAAIAASVALAGMAEGYQVNTFSAKQEGMGHVGVAMKLGAESNIFNPGALAFSDKTLEVSAAMSAIKSSVTATVDNVDYSSSNKVSTPMNVSAAFRVYDNFYAGVSFFTPYGSSIDWGKSWPGAVLSQSVDLKIFTVQPTLSYRPLKNLSFGAGLMISWGNVDLNKALVSSTSMDHLINLMNLPAQLQGQPGQYQPYGANPPASVNLKGDSELVLGVNLGVLWEVNDKVSFGASFRSKMEMHVTAGDAAVSYYNDQAQSILGQYIDALNYANFDASMPAPYVLTAGVAWKPIPRLTLAADFQLTGWKTYKQLDIAFPSLSDEQQAQFNQHLTKNYHNSMTYHLGGEFAMTDRLDLRAGLMIDQSPCDEDFYNPETPGMTKIEPSVGFSFRPVKGLSIDVAFMYVHGCGSTGTGRYDDFLATPYNAARAQYLPLLQQAGLADRFPELPQVGSMTADYKLHAVIPAIGLSYSF